MLFQPRSGIRMQLRAQACEVYAFAERLGGADSPPWQRRGGRAIKKYPRSFKRRGRGGSFNPRIDSNGSLNEPPRLRPAKVASRHFIDGRSHPSFAKEGNSSSFCFLRLLQIVWRDQDL